jgi:hypothetical protein
VEFVQNQGGFNKCCKLRAKAHGQQRHRRARR